MDDPSFYNVPAGGYPQLMPPAPPAGYAQITPPSININTTPIYDTDPYSTTAAYSPPQSTVKDQRLKRAMHYNRVKPQEQKVLSTIHRAVPHISAASMKKLVHLFSPGGAMNTFVILMCLFLGLLQVISFTTIVGFLTVGSASATNSSIILYPLVGGMFIVGVIMAAATAAYTKEDGTLALMAVTVLFLSAAGMAGRVMLLINTSPLTTTTCTGISYPEDVLSLFCTHYNATSTNSYKTVSTDIWTNREGRNEIIDAELCRNRSWLWYAYFINIGLFLVEVGLIAAVCVLVYYRKPSFSNISEQFKGILIIDQNAASEKIDENDYEEF